MPLDCTTMRLGDKLKKNFAKNLQTLRTQKELTQAKLVDALNQKYKDFDIELQRTSIVNYESEAAMPRIDALYCIADYFGKTVDQVISATMDKPVLRHPWMAQESRPEPVLNIETERKSSGTFEGGDVQALQTNQADFNSILATCVDGIFYRQFYVDFAKKLFEQLQDTAGNNEDREKFATMFYRTFLGCQISRNNYFQNLAKETLEPKEFEVFMAFKDHTSGINMVAKGLGMSEEEVILIFNRAQTKMSLEIEGNSKTDLS